MNWQNFAEVPAYDNTIAYLICCAQTDYYCGIISQNNFISALNLIFDVIIEESKQ